MNQKTRQAKSKKEMKAKGILYLFFIAEKQRVHDFFKTHKFYVHLSPGFLILYDNIKKDSTGQGEK
jgi:hypothetical protein